ncbi:MAG: FtsX-like permease family protein [Methanomicrobiales archaeon]|nr:FtsX-like permease family protein [Methanomicrobiales archaeon]
MGKKELKVALFLAWRSLTRGNRSSLALNVLIISMVFTNMIFFPALMNGIGQDVTKTVVDYQISNILISPKSGNNYITDLAATLSLINGMPGVERATPQYTMGATLKFRGRILGTTVYAIQSREEKYVTPVYTTMTGGTYLGDGDIGEMIIGTSVAGSPNILEADEYAPSLGGIRVGDSVTVEYANGFLRDYRVKGIFTTGKYEVDNRVFTTWEDMKAVTGTNLDKASYITVKVKPGYSDQFVKNELLQYGVMDKVQTSSDVLDKSLGRTLASFSIIGFISLIVSLVIAVVVLFIVIMIKTLNNRRQIGILKAIGVDKTVIMHSYGFQVIMLSTAGILMGFAFTGLLVLYMTIFPMVTPTFSATPYVTLADLATNGLILFAASVIAGYLPAWKVARENIQDVMRA